MTLWTIVITGVAVGRGFDCWHCQFYVHKRLLSKAWVG